MQSESSNGILQANDVLINSSQEFKQDISTLTKEEAYKLLEDLDPVKFSFKNDSSKEKILDLLLRMFQILYLMKITKVLDI